MSLADSRLFQRFWDIAGAASVRVKVLGIVLSVIVLLGAFVTLQLRASLTATLEQELRQQGMAIVNALTDRIASSASESLDALLTDWRVHYSDPSHNTLVEYIDARDISGTLIAQSRSDRALGIDLPDSTSAERSMPWGRVIEFAAPLSDDGLLRIGLAEDNVANTVNTVTWQILSLTLVMVAVGFGAAFFLTWILTRPILSLVDATHAVAKGDLTRQVPRWANDELGDLAESFNAMTRSLAAADRERGEREATREAYIQHVIGAQEDERKRIARELHDSTSQALSSLLLGLRRLEEEPSAGAMQQDARDLRAIVSHTLDEVHALAWQLRPSALDDLGLEVALQRYVADYERRNNLQVDFLMRGVGERLSMELETTVYRIVQEALTNIARHANAKHASILIEQRKAVIRIIIEDDGVGFDPTTLGNSSSLGLQGIRERTLLFSGKLTIESQPGAGASLYIELPLPASTAPATEIVK